MLFCVEGELLLWKYKLLLSNTYIVPFSVQRSPKTQDQPSSQCWVIPHAMVQPAAESTVGPAERAFVRREDTQLIFIDPENGRLQYSSSPGIDTFGCEARPTPAIQLLLLLVSHLLPGALCPFENVQLTGCSALQGEALDFLTDVDPYEVRLPLCSAGIRACNSE